MKKKEYIKPEMNIFKADTQAILTGSEPTIETIKFERASEFNYTEEDIKNLWDSEKTKTIWSD